MKGRSVTIAVVVLVAIAGVALLLLPDPDITYELNGGTNSPDNPSDYSGTEVFLSDPTRTGYSFDGWYSDSAFEDRVYSLPPSGDRVHLHAKWIVETYDVSYVYNGGTGEGNPETCTIEDDILLKDPYLFMHAFSGWYTDDSLSESSKVRSLKGVSSDTTLYAGWDSLVGKSYTYNVTGTVSYGGFVADLSGDTDLMYSAMDDDRYLTVSKAQLRISSDIVSDSLNLITSEWIEDGALNGMTFTGETVIDTIHGRKDVYVFEDETSKDYYGKDWTPYRSESKFVVNKTTIEMCSDLISQGTFEPKESYTVSVFHGDSISSVTGGGKLTSGSSVSLTASVSENAVFDGWYLGQDMKMDISGTTFSLDAIGCDLTLYALCDDDVILESPEPVTDPEWTVSDGFTGEYVTSAHSNPAIVSLPDNGFFKIKLTGKDSDGRTYTYSDNITTNGMFQVTFDWTYKRSEYQVTWADEYDNYVYYKNLNTDRRHHTTQMNDMRFVTYSDGSIRDIAEVLSELSKNMSRLDRANFVLAFVQQSVTYQLDSEGVGVEEYWKYPYETLYEKRGDCEDSAMLYAAIMKAMGYDVAILMFSDHMATGIGMPYGTPGTYYQKNDIRYYYCETTAKGWELGKIPDNYNKATVMVV